MKLGEKIRRLRVMAGLTQKELGKKIGFSAATADSRMRKYESCQMAPKEDIRTKLAEVLDVDMSALSDIDIQTYEDVMHVLFLLEEEFGMKIERTTEKTSLVFDNNANTASILNGYLYIWDAQKRKYEQSIDEVKDEAEDQYKRWKARFPKDIQSYCSDQLYKLSQFYAPFVQAAQESGCTISTVSDFIVQIRELCQCPLTIESETKLYKPGDGALVLTFLLSELLAPEQAETHKRFGEYLYMLSVMESFGMLIDKDLFTTECGTQISYTLHMSTLMALKSIIRDIQRFEKQADSNDWDKEMFEMDYEDTLRQFNISIAENI
ncbi:MAG: helix-turn-helix domain-containing protein [Lachnospiraceae bacterium]|nr:helix-turn-helix domain-containing protein [Lachnospiraceae bacterium]